jgi:hypothetical protein
MYSIPVLFTSICSSRRYWETIVFQYYLSVSVALDLKILRNISISVLFASICSNWNTSVSLYLPELDTGGHRYRILEHSCFPVSSRTTDTGK